MRPWALAAPIVVLLIALPLLRPLRHPVDVSRQEGDRLRAVAMHVDQGRFWTSANDPAELHETHPVFSLILSGPYWVLHKFGLRMDQNLAWVSYLLTVIGSTLPVAASASLVYRMSRMFELPRPWRAGLALAVVLASGLFSYATVLNPHPLAAMSVLAACACLVHVTIAGQPFRNGAALAVAGFFAALSAVVDPMAAIFLLLLPFTIVAMKWPWKLRLAAMLLYVFGALPPLALHLTMTNDPMVPSTLHPAKALMSHLPTFQELDDSMPSSGGDSIWVGVGTVLGQFLDALFGSHGLLSHYPIMLFALAGVAAVMHRHWPGSTKVLAATSVAAGITILAATVAYSALGKNAMFASRFFVCFSPLLLFWAGAFLRNRHATATWVTVFTLLGFSVIVSLIGATNPYPSGGYATYTPVAVIQTAIHPPPAPIERIAQSH